MTSVDPIEAHVAALERALRGPRRTRRSMVAEARAGLRDAAAAYRAGGLAPEPAARLAVRDFGTMADVVPSFQDELTARQGRWTALLFALVLPGLLLGWDLLWSTGAVSHDRAVAGDTVAALAGLQDRVTVVVAAVAAVLLAGTFRRTACPRRLTMAIGVTGTAGTLACGGIAAAMNVAGGRSTATLLTTNPAAIAAFAGSAVVVTLLAWQSVSTLRVAWAAAEA